MRFRRITVKYSFKYVGILSIKAQPSVLYSQKGVINNRMLPFLGTRLLNKSTHVETKVYVKPTSSGLLLH